MPYPDDDGLSPQVDYGESSFSPSQPSQPDQSQDDQSHSQDDFYGSELGQKLPSRVVGGIDQLMARRQRSMNTLLKQAQEHPIYDDGNGGVTHDAPNPYLTGQFIPIDANPYRIDNPRATPIQMRMAQQMQKQQQFPSRADGMPMSDYDIWQAAPKIWGQMLQQSGGNMTPDNLMNSPFWDQFKGLDNDTLAAVKASVIHHIKPLYDSYVNKQKTINSIGEEMADPDTGQAFSLFFKPYESAILADPGSKKSLGMIEMLKQKADILSNDPDAKESFGEIMQGSQKWQALQKSLMAGQTPTEPMTQAQVDDLRHQSDTMRSLMATKSTSGFSTILNHYIQYKQGLADKREKLVNSVDDWSEDANGSEELASQLQQAIKSGYYDGRERDLAHDLARLKKSDGMVKIGNAQIPGAKILFDEKAATNKIAELKKNGFGDNDIFITPDRKVLAGNDFERYENSDVKLNFPDSGIKGKGRYIQLPKDFFKDDGGQPVFLTIPGTQEHMPQSPITYTVGDKQYVLREAVQKIGLTKEDLNSNEFNVGHNLDKFVTSDATPYETKFITAGDFLSKDKKDGQRFQGEGWVEWQKYRQQIKDDLAEKELIMTQDPTSPTFAGELGKGVVRGFGKTITEGVLTGGEGLAMIYDTLRAGLYRGAAAAGVEGSAQEATNAWNRVKASYQRLGGLDDEVSEASAGGFLGLNNVMIDPNATMKQHVGGAIGEIAGTIGGIALEMYATGGMGAPAVAEKLTALGARAMGYQAELTRLASLAGKASDIAKIRNNIGRANIVLNESLNFMAQNLLTGHANPTDMAEGAGYGAILGLGRLPGRGFFGGKAINTIKETETEGGLVYKEIPGLIKSPAYADKTRMKWATVAAGGTVGLDTIIKTFSGMSTQQQLDWWKSPENAAGMALQLMMPYFGAHGFHGEDIKRSQMGVPHGLEVAYPSKNAPIRAAGASMEATPTMSMLPQAEPNIYGSLDDHYAQATMAELSERGVRLAQHIEDIAKRGEEPPAALLQEFEIVRQRLLGPQYRQGIIIGSSRVRDLEEWGILKKMLPQLENKEPAKEVKLLGLQKTPEGPQVSEVTKMSPAELVEHINTVRQNPVRQYSEQGKFNAAIRRLIDIRTSPEFDALPSNVKAGIRSIFSDNSLLERASRPEEMSEKIGDSIVDHKANGTINSKTVENAIKIKKTVDRLGNERGSKEASNLVKKQTGWAPRPKSEGGFLERDADGNWRALAKRTYRSGEIDPGDNKFTIQNSKGMLKTDAELLAKLEFDRRFNESGERMQQMAAHELYGEESSNPHSVISESDRELARSLFEDAFEKNQDIGAVVSKLTGDKYGFSREEADAMMNEFVKDQSESLGETRDFLREESKDNGCDL